MPDEISHNDVRFLDPNDANDAEFLRRLDELTKRYEELWAYVQAIDAQIARLLEVQVPGCAPMPLRPAPPYAVTCGRTGEATTVWVSGAGQAVTR